MAAALRYFLSCSLLTIIHGYMLEKLGSFDIPNPSYVALYPRGPEDIDLLVSTFNPSLFSKDSLTGVARIGDYLKNVSSIKPVTITTEVVWPNEVSIVPESVFGKGMVVIPQGFLLPGKTDGAISLLNITTSTAAPEGPYQLTDDQSGKWFYHRVIWKDMDRDGDLDAVTCRAKEPIIGKKDSELLWLENQGQLGSPWTPHVITHGPDVFLRNATLLTPDGSKDCIITAQFFTKSLSVYWTDNVNNSWKNLSQVNSRVIDDAIGAVFAVEISDLNADGKLDLLVTENGLNGSLYAYEIPDDFRTEKFTRHTLANGFKPKEQKPGSGAPGAPAVLFPKTSGTTQSQKPSILLSGDDEGTAYFLEPTSNSTSDWSYNITTFLDAGNGTVGQLGFGDVDGDGFQEVFAPSYSTNQLFVYTFHD